MNDLDRLLAEAKSAIMRREIAELRAQLAKAQEDGCGDCEADMAAALEAAREEVERLRRKADRLDQRFRDISSYAVVEALKDEGIPLKGADDKLLASFAEIDNMERDRDTARAQLAAVTAERDAMREVVRELLEELDGFWSGCDGEFGRCVAFKGRDRMARRMARARAILDTPAESGEGE